MVLPKGRVAANARSPNRRPRTREVYRDYRLEQAKKTWLEHFGATGNFFEACVAVGRTAEVVRRWIHEDRDFSAKWALLREAKKMLQENRLEDMVGKALEVYGATLAETKDKKLAFEAARRLLVSAGLLKEGEAVQVAVQVNTSIRGDDLARIYLDARRAFLQDGGEPVGLADGGGNGERPTTGGGADKVPAVAAPAESASGDRKE